MATFPDLILVEIDGQDVLTWHLAYDPFPQVRTIIRTPGATEMVVVDGEGRIDDLVYEFTPDDVRVAFRKRSDYYTMLHRRRDFVKAQATAWTCQDTWPVESTRYFAWFFPPHSRITALDPATLTPLLAQWHDQPRLAGPLSGLTLAATYDVGAETASSLPRRERFDFDALLCDLAPPHGTEAEILCQLMRGLAEVDALLGQAMALRALLAQDLDLNMNAPGTRALIR